MAFSDKIARSTLITAAITHPIASLVYFRIYHYILFFGLVCFVFSGGMKKMTGWFRHPFSLACFVLFIFPFVSYFWSIDPSTTLFRAALVSMHIPLFILTVSIAFDNPRKQPYVLLTFYVTAFIIVSAYIFLSFGGIRASSYEMKQATGAFSNVAASLVLCCLPFFMSNKNKVFPPFVNYFMLISSILIIIISQSRSALGLTIVAFGLSFLVFPGRNLGRFTRIFVSLALILLISIFVGSTDITGQFLSGTIDRFLGSQIFSSVDILDNILNPDRSKQDYTRALMYSHGWDVIRNNWLFGSGFGTFKQSMEAAVGRGTISHNWVITSLGEMGVIGFLSMVGVMIFSVFQSWKLSRMSRLPDSLRLFSAQLFVALCLLFFQSLIRPLYPNPLFSIFLGLSVWIIICTKDIKRAP